MMKKGIVIFFILVILGFSVFLFTRTRPQKVINAPKPTPLIIYPTITSDIIITLIAKNNNQVVKLSIEGIPEDVKTIDYELTYLTGDGLSKGVLGEIKLQGEKAVTRDDIVLGTCSSGKCVYDTGVQNLDLSLKFNSIKGASVFRKSYTL